MSLTASASTSSMPEEAEAEIMTTRTLANNRCENCFAHHHTVMLDNNNTTTTNSTESDQSEKRNNINNNNSTRKTNISRRLKSAISINCQTKQKADDV